MNRQRRMRWIVALCATVSIVAAGVAAPGAGAESPSWHATFAAAGYGFGDCCTFTTTLSDQVTAARIGAAKVDGEQDYCGHYLDEPLCPDHDGTTFALRFSTPSGDLSIAGFTPRGTTTQGWAVTGGTGRFSRATGSGTYSLVFDASGPSPRIVVTLDGALVLRGAGGPATG